MSDKSHQKDVFLAALMSEPTVLLAAQRAGISQSTATRWIKDPQFKAAYAEARRGVLGEALALLQGTMLAAVLTLRHTMLSDASKPQTKVLAARTVLELGLRSFELEGIEAKMNHILEEIRELRTHAAL